MNTLLNKLDKYFVNFNYNEINTNELEDSLKSLKTRHDMLNDWTFEIDEYFTILTLYTRDMNKKYSFPICDYVKYRDILLKNFSEPNKIKLFPYTNYTPNKKLSNYAIYVNDINEEGLYKDKESIRNEVKILYDKNEVNIKYSNNNSKLLDMFNKNKKELNEYLENLENLDIEYENNKIKANRFKMFEYLDKSFVYYKYEYYLLLLKYNLLDYVNEKNVNNLYIYLTNKIENTSDEQFIVQKTNELLTLENNFTSLYSYKNKNNIVDLNTFHIYKDGSIEITGLKKANTNDMIRKYNMFLSERKNLQNIIIVFNEFKNLI